MYSDTSTKVFIFESGTTEPHGTTSFLGSC